MTFFPFSTKADVANELEKDVSRLQLHCDEMAIQVTQLTQGKGNLILLLKRIFTYFNFFFSRNLQIFAYSFKKNCNSLIGKLFSLFESRFNFVF